MSKVDGPLGWGNARPATLAETLSSMGITVPDQKKAEHMKEAMRLGISVTASKARVRIVGWLLALREDYKAFEYSRFDSRIAINWGGEMPAEVRLTAERVRKALPHVQLEVHATFDDPWLVAVCGDEKLILHGWYRSRQTMVSEVIL